jgi:hypothetical protein
MKGLLRPLGKAMLCLAFLSLRPALARAQAQHAATLTAETVESMTAVEATPKRIMGFIPNFQTTNAQAVAVPPLTPKKKFVLATYNAFDFSAHVGNLLQTGVGQLTNSQPHYGEGWAAVGERFSALERDQVTGSYLNYAILPIVFHEDPRYFRRGHGSAPARIGYAISRAVVTRRDAGGWTFNKSQVVGSLIAGEISTTYYPAQDRNLEGVALNCAVGLVYKGGFNLLSEYYPDFLALIHHKRKLSQELAVQTTS